MRDNHNYHFKSILNECLARSFKVGDDFNYISLDIRLKTLKLKFFSWFNYNKKSLKIPKG